MVGGDEMINATGVSLIYPNGTMGLESINLQMEAGEIVYITGPSGSGKTSLLKLFMGIEFPTAGSLKVLGQPVIKGQDEGIRHLRMMIGPVFQEFKLVKGRTAMENVMMGMRFLGITSAQLKENASSALSKVGLKHKESSMVENLSLGERQRVAIARAVTRKPALILADEPTGNLDMDNALNILELLTSFKDNKTSVIITTHATHLIENQKYVRHIHMENASKYWERVL